MTKLEKKVQRLSQTLNVSGSEYDKDKIGKDPKDAFIKYYIKTSQIPSQDSLYDFKVGGPKGFYAMDGAKFDEILKHYLDKDRVVRKEIINELKNTYPILYQQKKTQRFIIPQLEKRFIWDVSLYNECIKELCESSIFCDTQLMNNIVNYLSYEGSGLDRDFFDRCYQVVYVNYDNNENATDIFICDDHFNYANKVEKIIEKIPNPTTIKKIKVTNNKINFFVPFDFNKTEAPDQARQGLSLQKSEKFEERAVKCLNGEYKIQLFVDDTFNENQNKIKKYDQEIFPYDINNMDIKDELDEDDHLRVYKKMHDKLKKKYAIKDIGSYIFYISLIK